jgi:class 3 adenylate cyclase
VLLCVEAKLPAQGNSVTSERVERRLAAVLAADVAGYSRLMGRDEEGTLAALKSFRKSLVDPAITAHRGRIVKTTGDGMLVEFASAVDAARCALEVQRGMVARNGTVPQDTRIELRIGIHVGDIIIDDDDIFGDGVSIAARLEGIAKPGVARDSVHSPRYCTRRGRSRGPSRRRASVRLSALERGDGEIGPPQLI